MKGNLFQFGDGLVGFISGTGKSLKRVVVFIGGLGDTLLGLEYLEPLALALGGLEWGLCQCLLSSSGTGYGTSSISRDVQEIDQLITKLMEKYDTREIVLCGHSTGCQDACSYMRLGSDNKDFIKGVVLQGPVSDRDWLVHLPDTSERLEMAHEHIKEDPDWLLPLTAEDRTPTTAKRFISLVERGGDDDMFSLDLTMDELSVMLGHMSVPTLICFSMQDEYVPEGHEKIALKLHQAIKGSTLKLYGGAGHALSGDRDTKMFVVDLCRFVRNIST